MEDPTATSSNNSSAPGPSTFKPANAFLPPSAASSANTAGTLRNASNGADESSSSVDGADAAAAASSMATNGETTTTAPAAQAAAPIKPVNRSASSKRAIIHSSVQRRNPVLGELQRLKQTTEIGDIPSDYQVGEHAGLLFLSLKYHRLHPEYIHTRIEKIKNRYKLRILMVLCDVNEHHLSIKELSKIAIHNDLTMMVAWSNDEVAQYIAQFKIYEHKSADTLKEKVHQQYREQLQHVLTTGKRVNKTDANNLASQFGSFTNIVHQQAKALSGVKGLGKTKVETLVDAFHKPFLVGGLKRKADGGEVDAFTSSVSGHPTAAVPESGAASSSNGRGEADRSKGKGKDKGKQRAEAGLEEEGEAEETPGSPDWPDEDIEDDEDAAREMEMDMEQEMIPSRRGRSPSRSPGLSPEPQPVRERVAGDADGAAWRDPLDDDDVDNEAGEDEDEPAIKRAKR